MLPFLIAAGIVSLIIAVVAGYHVGTTHKIPVTPPGKNDPNLAACPDLCNQWDNRRSERCRAQADETAARSRADVLRAELAIALAVVGGFLAAGATAAAAGAPGWIAAGIAFTAAGIAALTSAYLTGLLAAADQDVLRIQAIAHDAREREAAARQQVLEHCSPEDANLCLNRASPC